MAASCVRAAASTSTRRRSTRRARRSRARRSTAELEPVRSIEALPWTSSTAPNTNDAPRRERRRRGASRRRRARARPARPDAMPARRAGDGQNGAEERDGPDDVQEELPASGLIEPGFQTISDEDHDERQEARAAREGERAAGRAAGPQLGASDDRPSAASRSASRARPAFPVGRRSRRAKPRHDQQDERGPDPEAAERVVARATSQSPKTSVITAPMPMNDHRDRRDRRGSRPSRSAAPRAWPSTLRIARGDRPRRRGRTRP